MQLESLRTWFLKYRRDLPWRKTKNPYHVWISEVMLQQTQVEVVKSYFERFIRAFPTIVDLADADSMHLMKLWEGLGYYSRARNLQKGAKIVVEKFKGHIPQTRDELLKIPGIGPYTAAAILSFAHLKKALAIDGNVLRVLARFFGQKEDVTKPSVQKSLAKRVHLPEEKPYEIAEGLIELGALVCKKQPKCFCCPLKTECKAYLTKTQMQLPVRKKRPKIQRLKRLVLILMHNQNVLVKHNCEKKVMQDLLEFPYFEEKNMTKTCAKKYVEKLGLRGQFVRKMPIVKHSFTRYSIVLFPFIFEIEKKDDENFEWLTIKECETRAFSSGHKRILTHVTHG
ncbi:MAG: Adenine DNA glycosylase [Chlamydiae bacterium]|nr:Adenine DNA glycosylase [Chlamydiota bacterium]